MNGMLTVKQIAEKLIVDPETVRRWLRRGILAGYRANRMWRIGESDLDAFLRQRREPVSTREAK